MSLTIKKIESIDELYRHYDRQSSSQGCYVELDCRDEVLTASYNAEIGNAVPSAVWHGHVQRWGIPLLTVDRCNDLLDDIAPLAEQVIDGYESVWDGNNNVARFDDDAREAIDEIDHLTDESRFRDESELIEEWNVGDWLQYCDKPTADTTDKELAEMVSDAEPTEENIVIHGDIEEYFNDIRHTARQQVIEDMLDNAVDEYKLHPSGSTCCKYIVRFRNGRIAYLSYNADGQLQWERSDLIADGIDYISLGIAECNLYRNTRQPGGTEPRQRPILPATSYDAALCNAVPLIYRDACRAHAVKELYRVVQQNFRAENADYFAAIDKYNNISSAIAELNRQLAELKESLPADKPKPEYFSLASNSAACRYRNLTGHYPTLDY